MRLVALLSGGIDSPVAAYIMCRAGADVMLLHMDNRPYTDGRSMEKVELIAGRLREVTGKDLPLFVAAHGDSQSRIGDACGAYQCVMCKRTMMFVASEFARRNGCSGVIMGDSLGQVASQTLKNIRAETAGLGFPVVRPLIGMDKIEIEAVGKEIGTYGLSILPEPTCGAVPPRPVTEAEPSKVLEFQDRIGFADIVRTSVDSVRLVSGRP